MVILQAISLNMMLHMWYLTVSIHYHRLATCRNYILYTLVETQQSKLCLCKDMLAAIQFAVTQQLLTVGVKWATGSSKIMSVHEALTTQCDLATAFGQLYELPNGVAQASSSSVLALLLLVDLPVDFSLSRLSRFSKVLVSTYPNNNCCK